MTHRNDTAAAPHEAPAAPVRPTAARVAAPAPDAPSVPDSGSREGGGAREFDAAVEAAAEPHEPAPGESAARDRVRAEATGMAHHEAQDALEAARGAGEDPAVVAEWERIGEHLADHGGPYAPESDPYVQGQLTARSHHGHDRP
ncbi:hypothetical protein ACGFXC_14510 [Streptomyces sp. NPDC048507]|uniref:hypothetical protein n=1 Tax=Streptomyces sp. NPDC048507 TaxID=3365560 RepID=UPI0037112BA1